MSASPPPTGTTDITEAEVTQESPTANETPDQQGGEQGGHDQADGGAPADGEAPTQAQLDLAGLYETEVKEQDRWLPIANVARIMKIALPDNAKIAKEAKECMQECVSEFISFITSEAAEKCQHEKRKTVNGEDILFAMTSLGFENYGEALKIYLARYREATSANSKHVEASPQNSPTALPLAKKQKVQAQQAAQDPSAANLFNNPLFQPQFNQDPINSRDPSVGSSGAQDLQAPSLPAEGDSMDDVKTFISGGLQTNHDDVTLPDGNDVMQGINAVLPSEGVLNDEDDLGDNVLGGVGLGVDRDVVDGDLDVAGSGEY